MWASNSDVSSFFVTSHDDFIDDRSEYSIEIAHSHMYCWMVSTRVSGPKITTLWSGNNSRGNKSTAQHSGNQSLLTLIPAAVPANLMASEHRSHLRKNVNMDVPAAMETGSAEKLQRYLWTDQSHYYSYYQQASCLQCYEEFLTF